MTTTPTPDTNSGETPTPRTAELRAQWRRGDTITVLDLFEHAEKLERELSRPVAPVTGLPDGCPETLMFPVGPHAKGNPHIECPDCRGTCTPVEILPVGSRERLRALEAREAERQEALEDVQEKLTEIMEWAKAYPVSIFPEPDLKKAHELLTAGGMTLDAISASNFRWILGRMVERCAAAIPPVPAPLCLCGRALEEHTPDKDIGCTGFRPV